MVININKEEVDILTTTKRVYGGSLTHTATYRSGLEKTNADYLKRLDEPVVYEQYEIPFTRPQTNNKYTPDFILNNNIIIETKGIFDTDDRKKHQLIKKQHPTLDVRFVFTNSKSKIYKGSPTTYGAWCTKNDFKFADRLIPEAWLKEPKSGRADPYTILKPKKT